MGSWIRQLLSHQLSLNSHHVLSPSLVQAFDCEELEETNKDSSKTMGAACSTDLGQRAKEPKKSKGPRQTLRSLRQQTSNSRLRDQPQEDRDCNQRALPAAFIPVSPMATEQQRASPWTVSTSGNYGVVADFGSPRAKMVFNPLGLDDYEIRLQDMRCGYVAE